MTINNKKCDKVLDKSSKTRSSSYELSLNFSHDIFRVTL